jgi:hypothetical protein
VRDGINLGKGCFEKLQQLVSRSSDFSPYREKVAEELLQVSHVSIQDILNHYMRINLLLMRVRQQDGEKLIALARQLPTDPLFTSKAYV